MDARKSDRPTELSVVESWDTGRTTTAYYVVVVVVMLFFLAVRNLLPVSLSAYKRERK